MGPGVVVSWSHYVMEGGEIFEGLFFLTVLWSFLTHVWVNIIFSDIVSQTQETDVEGL